MVDGSVQTFYKDADFVTQFARRPFRYSGFQIANTLCCLAYVEDGEINNSYELTFACEEILVVDFTSTYDSETGNCYTETE